MTGSRMAMSSDFLAAFAKLPSQQQRLVRAMMARFERDSRAIRTQLREDRGCEGSEHALSAHRRRLSRRRSEAGPRQRPHPAVGRQARRRLSVGDSPRLQHQRRDRGVAGVSAAADSRGSRRNSTRRYAGNIRTTQAPGVVTVWCARRHGGGSPGDSRRSGPGGDGAAAPRRSVRGPLPLHGGRDLRADHPRARIAARAGGHHGLRDRVAP